MKFNSHVIFLIAIVGIITAGVVGATVLGNGTMKQVDFDGIKVNVPSDADFVKTPDGYADSKYGITINTFQNNASIVSYLKGITGANVIALKNQPPQSVAFVQGDDTHVVITNGAQGISIGAKDQSLVTDMSNSVVFSNHQKSVKPKAPLPLITPPPHMELDVDFNLIIGILTLVNTNEFNVIIFENNITPMINDYNINVDNGTIDEYTADEFAPLPSDNSQNNASLLDNPQVNSSLGPLSPDNSGGSAGGNANTSDSGNPSGGDSGAVPSLSPDSESSSGPDVSSGNTPSSSDDNDQPEKLTKDEIKKYAELKYPGKIIDVNDIEDKGDYYLVLIKESSGVKKVKFDAYTGEKIEN